MSKTVPTDHEFNRERFAELLTRAKGARTQTQFANDCGLSASHLNRYYNLQKEHPPIPSTIVKIAQNAENDVTWEELMDAAGYDPTKTRTARRLLAYANYSNYISERLVVSRVLFSLSNCGFKWSVPSANETLKIGNWRPDININIEGSNILEHWFFEIRLLSTDTPYSSWLMRFYGFLSLQKFSPKTKISLVVASEEVYNTVKDFPPLALPIYFSVILYDIDTDRISKEEYVPTALDVTDDLTTVFTLKEDS